jgi:NADP-dependent 3-hydroxy acid dehydrogenase YdfG
MTMATTTQQRTAIVTGAASGMGQSTAAALIEQGWEVLALDRVAAQLQIAGQTVHTVEVDVTRRTEVAEAIAANLSEPAKSVQLVANVAGVYPPSTLADFTEERYRAVFDVNVLGVLNVTAESVPY